MQNSRNVLLSALLVVLATTARAENRFYVDPTVIDSGSDAVSQIVIRADNDVDVLGYSFGVSVDESLVTLDTFVMEESVASGADFVAGSVVAETGIAGYGIVFDTDGDFETQRLVAGNGHVIAVIGASAAQAVDAETTLVFEPVEVQPAPNPPIANVMTDPDGKSIKPGREEPGFDLTLENGTITLSSGAPVITSVTGNAGLPGTVFQVVGTNFDAAGLEVTLCGVAAEATLREDDVTIDVTAPECETIGFEAVTVTTDRGSDTEANGFEYTDPGAPPSITGLSGNSGLAGKVFQITGTGFGGANLVVTICGTEATAVANAQGTSIDVTAPECETIGFEAVEVCTDLGCDSEANGFDYRDPNSSDGVFLRGDTDDSGGHDLTDGIKILGFLFLGQPAARCYDAMDSNDDGGVDLTDGVYIFTWLFLGGNEPPPPFPNPGEDPSDDTLPPCDDAV